MTIETELIEDLGEELKIADPKYNEALLKTKVKATIKEVIRARRYPDDFSIERIENDLQKFYSNLRAISLYDYNKIGMDSESNHVESGVTQTFSSRDKLFYGILPLSRL